jgi:hypothetical protein
MPRPFICCWVPVEFVFGIKLDTVFNNPKWSTLNLGSRSRVELFRLTYLSSPSPATELMPVAMLAAA